jgi:hypothetical protein
MTRLPKQNFSVLFNSHPLELLIFVGEVMLRMTSPTIDKYR